jgi:hypothetical protein
MLTSSTGRRTVVDMTKTERCISRQDVGQCQLDAGHTDHHYANLIYGREWWPDTPRHCGTCGELEGSVYAKHCCTPDNMIDA